MKRTLVALLLILVVTSRALAGGAPSETVVLVNTRSVDSQRVADHYVAARGIPPTNVCRIACDSGLTITRDAFVRDVVDPLRIFLRDQSLLSRVRFVVLTQGMPIRADGEGGAVSTAAMLALLDTRVCGAPGARLPRYRNPYTSGPAPREADVVSGGRLYLVTALISSTADEAIALIDRSVLSDGTAPEKAHFVYQDANGAAGNRNGQYDQARKAIERDEHTTEHVKSGPDVVTGRKRVMGYMSGGAYSKLSPEKVRENEYLPGAICDMLQSFGAVPKNFGPDGKGGSQFPVTHMVRAGVTGVHGTVAEPYNVAFPSADLFSPYVAGYTLAETFHQKLPYRYWMNLVLGDPLCAPYARRLDFQVAVSQPKVWRGEGTIDVTAPTAVRIEAFLDGVSLGATEGAEAHYAVDARLRRAGVRQLLVEVTGPGATEPRSWRTVTLTLANDAARPIAEPAQLPFGGALDIPLTSAPKTHALAFVAAGTPLPHTLTATPSGLHAAFDWSSAGRLAGGTADVRLTLDDEEFAWTVRIGPRSLRVEAPERVTAGERATIRVTAVDAAGEPVRGWNDSIELRSTSPSIRWGVATLDDEGSATLAFTSSRAARFDLLARPAHGGDGGPFSVDVVAGAPHHATTPLSRMPLGQVTDVPIRIEDRFGNSIAGEERTLSVEFPDDPHALVPGKLRLAADRASGVLRDVVLSKPGRQRVVIRDAGGKVWSQPGESVDVRPDHVRAWLVTRAFLGDDAAALFESDPAANASADGGVLDSRLFRRLRDRDSTVDLPAAGSRDGDASCAVAFVEALTDTDAVLRLSAAGRTRVLIDGKEVFDGVPKETNPRKNGKDTATVKLPRGRHRVTVVTERKGRFAFRLALAAGKTAFAPSLRIRGESGAEPARPCVSGRVLRAGGGAVAGAAITLVDGDGADHETVTASDGSFFVVAPAPGDAVVRLTRAPGLTEALERAITVEEAHVVDVDFRLVDDDAPTIAVPSPPKRVGRNLRLTAEIRDASGIAEAWLTAGEARIGEPLTRGPFLFEADVSELPRGPLEIVVVARDRAGNVGRSAPIALELVTDTKGPKITLRGLARNATLKKTTEVRAGVTDPLGVAVVEFLLDGAALGAPRTEPPYVASLDPGALDAGRHVLVCIARDSDGNETRKELSFRVKRVK